MRTEIRAPGAGPVLTLPTDDVRLSQLRLARALSWVLAVCATLAAFASLFIADLFPDETAWAREAFRGGDLVTLVVAVPTLIAAVVLVRRGSIRAIPVWVGALFYFLYMDAYAVFGAAFNDAFLLHIAVFSLAMFAIACALPAIDRTAVADAFRPNRAARGIGVFLIVVGIGQGGLWLFVLVRNVLTGELLHDIPVLGQHVVFALDLSLLVPMLIVSGVLLARRRPSGYLLGTAMAVMGAITQLNLNIAGVFQANADVPGITAFPPEGVFLLTAFVVAALLLLIGGRGDRRSEAPAPGGAARLP